MDSSLTIKPSPIAAKGRALRDPVAVREAVDAELIGPHTVAATGHGDGNDGGAKDGNARNGNPDAEPRPDHAPHDLLTNPDSRDVIYRERDVRAIEREHPDQALLRQRAYHRLTPAPEATIVPADDPHADIKA